MKLYGAIDLHSTNNVTVVINEQEKPSKTESKLRLSSVF